MVERVISLRGETPTLEFSLHGDVPEDPSLFEKCIRTVLRCNVQKLTLSLDDEDIPYVALPLKSETLKELELDTVLIFLPASSICLPNLKVLKLSDTIFVDRVAPEKLFSSPSLESLSLCNCEWREVMTMHISAPNLQFLHIDEYLDPHVDPEDVLSYQSHVYINGASLRSFSYGGELMNEYHILGGTTQLVESGQINVRSIYGEPVLPQECELLRAVANVKELILSHCILKNVGKRSVHLDTLPLFCNVTSLRLCGNINYSSFRGLSKILRRSPHLTSLAFSEFLGRFPMHKRAGLFDPVPLCFQAELKHITFDSFGGDVRYAKDLLCRAFAQDSYSSGEKENPFYQ